MNTAILNHSNSTSDPVITYLIIAAFVVSFLMPAVPLLASGDHPGPAQQPQLQQFPQTTSRAQQNSTQTREVSKADISAGIKKHIANDTKKSSDRKFHVKYQNKDLALDLVKVHDDQLSSLSAGKYFACVDMKATNGTIYDIDFFMAGQPGSMRVTETSVHKINGKPLYNWKEENGVWKRVRAS
ncbi:MAG: hypothetical protein DME60_13105 [Verrucomicrobia bacterium]|nr:MAG: hypothetical protein DME60_13105 [Verrucomicrobiota bacterium]